MSCRRPAPAPAAPAGRDRLAAVLAACYKPPAPVGSDQSTPSEYTHLATIHRPRGIFKYRVDLHAANKEQALRTIAHTVLALRKQPELLGDTRVSLRKDDDLVQYSIFDGSSEGSTVDDIVANIKSKGFTPLYRPRRPIDATDRYFFYVDEGDRPLAPPKPVPMHGGKYLDSLYAVEPSVAEAVSASVSVALSGVFHTVIEKRGRFSYYKGRMPIEEWQEELGYTSIRLFGASRR